MTMRLAIRNALRVYDYLFVAKTDEVRVRSILHCVFLALGMVVIFSFAFWSHLFKPFPILNDGHMVYSFEQAINRVYFGKNELYKGPNDSIARQLVTIPDKIISHKLTDLPASVDKSPDEYRKFLRPFLNNENGLTYQHELLVRLFPRITVGEFGIALNLSRFLCLAIFSFALLRLNFSVVMAGSSLLGGMVVIDMVNQTHAYSLYPNLIAILLLLIGISALSLKAVSRALRLQLLIPCSIAIGCLGAITWNFRSSYFPIAIGIFALFVIYVALEAVRTRNGSRRHNWRLLCATCLGLSGGAFVAQTIFISSLPTTGTNYQYHVIWHPMVLGLAVPESQFAKERGIAWNDANGQVLARQIDPEAIYLGPTYERALMKYYFRLWQLHPDDMLSIYANKLKVAGMGAVAAGSGYFSPSFSGYNEFRTVVKALVSPFRAAPDGRYLLATSLTIFLIGLFSTRYISNRPMSFLVTAVALSGFLVFLEHAIILPAFNVSHFSFLLFWFLFAALIIYQVLFNLISLGLHSLLTPGSAIAADQTHPVVADKQDLVVGGTVSPKKSQEDKCPTREYQLFPDVRQAKTLVSIVTPVFNEQGVIVAFHERLCKVIGELENTWDFEIIFVDDGSHDQSLEIMRNLVSENPRLRVVELRRNYGQTAALQAGIDMASGDIVITMDSDLQHFPEEIPDFLSKLSEGYDIVCGWRAARAEGIIRRWPSRIANLLIHWITGLSLHDFGTTFRAYRGELVKDIRLYGEFHRFVPVMGHILGARIAEIPIMNIERPEGKSNYGIGRTFGVFLDLIVVYFFVRHMDRPMRFFGKLGAAMSLIGLGVLGALFIYAYTYNVQAVKDRIGWFMISIVFLLGGLQALCTGILAEILIRVRYEQGNDRVYNIRNEYSQSR
jgi:glycosyltransferase involved in cell wall biosynthesis